MSIKDILISNRKSGKTWKQIASEMGLTYHEILSIRKKFDMDIKSGLAMSRSKLINEYANKTPTQIAKEYNLSRTHIYRMLKRYNIDLKNNLPSKEELLKEYNDNKLSKPKLAEKFSCSISAINRLFKKYKIKARSNSESQLVRSTEIRQQMKKQWRDNNYIKKMIGDYNNIKDKMNHLAKEQLGKESKIQKILYSILDDMDINYEKEKIIGFWRYDCYLSDYKIIIECQGDYWHSLEKTKIKDQQKASYIHNNFPEMKLIRIWENEFKCKSLVLDIIKHHTNKTITKMNFNINNTYITHIDADDAELFLSKYDYACKLYKKYQIYGIYLNDLLIAVSVFDIQNDFAKLLHFCIHPKSTTNNFKEYALNKSINTIKSENTNLKYIIYESNNLPCENWELTGKTKQSHCYMNKNGYVMLEKTLHNHAKKVSMSDEDFALSKGYAKIIKKPKNRYRRMLPS